MREAIALIVSQWAHFLEAAEPLGLAPDDEDGRLEDAEAASIGF